MNLKIKFIYFDLGGVVFHFRGGLEKLALKFNLDYEDFRRIFTSLDNKVCRGEIAPNELWQIYCKRLDLPASSIEDFADYWVGNFEPILETRNLIINAASKYRIGLLTNIYKDIFPRIVEIGLLPDVEWSATILSCEEGYVKPERELYEIATIHAQVSPNEILFIDDKQEFLDGAKLVGWKTFKFDELRPQKSVQSINSLLHLD